MPHKEQERDKNDSNSYSVKELLGGKSSRNYLQSKIEISDSFLC